MRMLLSGPYVPTHQANRMAHEGDVRRARESFLASRFNNLDVLLEHRFGWMRDHIRCADKVVEFGCGAGFSPLYIDHPQLILTDVLPNEWVHQHADAMNPPFAPESIDVIICSHMIHHMASPVTFFEKVRPILKPGGRILIQDINTSLLMRALLRVMRHEGWSFAVNVFDKHAVANDPKDPWSANCAIPELLFRSSADFERHVLGYRVTKNEVNECLLFPLSGGVIARTRVPQLPRAVLKLIAGLDRILVQIAPSVFACGRSVVLTKSETV